MTPFAAALAVSVPVRANLIINATYDTTIATDPNVVAIESGIDAAIKRVEGDIANNVTVNITFKEKNAGLGESLTFHYTVLYSDYVDALLNPLNQTPSAADTTAIASLGYVPGVTTANPVNGSDSVFVQTALARTLGIADSGVSDGTISLNTSIMNLARTGPQNSNFYDLQAVAGHEIDEVLGIGGPGSAMQLLGAYTGQASPAGAVGLLDLYRYTSLGIRSFTMDPAQTAYFSINGGATNLVNFNQNGASKADFADWGNGGIGAGNQSGNTPPQIQDAFGNPGGIVNIGTNELTALDVIGYNLALVPEPGTMALCALGAIGMLFAARRWRQRRA